MLKPGIGHKERKERKELKSTIGSDFLDFSFSAFQLLPLRHYFSLFTFRIDPSGGSY